ncbi:MAG: hypothetical protein ISR69_09640 [Gammaproteobacteria bacterium]|nr:hypothetical protein [Gammaproteobacteria bacterium]
MKTYGKRQTQTLALKPSAELLLRASEFNDSMQALMPIKKIFMDRGYKVFKTHEEANDDWDEAVKKRMLWAKQHAVFKKND